MRNSDGVMSNRMPRRSSRGMDFEKMIASGEAKGAPFGFRGQTANGTAQAAGTGWNSDGPMSQMPEVPTGGAWQGRRSTRSGE